MVLHRYIHNTFYLSIHMIILYDYDLLYYYSIIVHESIERTGEREGGRFFLGGTHHAHEMIDTTYYDRPCRPPDL